ncbi:MAG TPA: hypothetical protein VKX16_10340 [Chloroflexota bacterium]|nr:hypothetical protein [Chloroflexota bacterium]
MPKTAVPPLATASTLGVVRPDGTTITVNAQGVLSAAGGAGQGTVTSVGLTMPGDFSVSGSPVTSSGTLAVTRANQNANTILAGPSSGGAAAPSYRALVTADLPAGTGTVTSVALTAPAEVTVAGSPVTTSGTLALTWTAQAKNLVFAGPSSGANAAPSFRAMVSADLPIATVSALGAVQPDGSTITINGSGVITAAASSASQLSNGSASLKLTATGGLTTATGTAPTTSNANSSVTSITVAAGSTDVAGAVYCTVNTTAIAAGTVWFRLNFATAFTHAPFVVITRVVGSAFGQSIDSANLGNFFFIANVGAGYFDVAYSAGTGTTSHTYCITYHAIGQ